MLEKLPKAKLSNRPVLFSDCADAKKEMEATAFAYENACDALGRPRTPRASAL